MRALTNEQITHALLNDRYLDYLIEWIADQLGIVSEQAHAILCLAIAYWATPEYYADPTK